MKINWITILLIIVAVLATLQIRSFFEGKTVDEKAVEDRVKLEQLQKEYPQIVRERDSISERYDSLISASQQRFNQLETRKQPIYNAIRQVPIVVNNFDKEQLRRAITEFAK